MITWRNGTVSGTRREWPGAVELDVLVDGAAAGGVRVRALAYPALTGRPSPGDRGPGPAAARPGTGRPSGQGPLLAAAGHRARRGRAGFAAPRGAARRGRHRRDARRGGRPALGSPGRAGRGLFPGRTVRG